MRCQATPLDELLEQSDIVTLHVPLDPTTHGMISTPQLEKMRSDAVLINTCRGPVVDEPALIEALRANLISGAVMDVSGAPLAAFAPERKAGGWGQVTTLEPIEADNPLLTLPNAIVTPHIAGDAAERGLRESTFALRQAERVADPLREVLSIVPPGENAERLGLDPAADSAPPVACSPACTNRRKFDGARFR